MKKIFVSTLMVLSLVNTIKGQSNDTAVQPYDAPQDTIRKVVEVVKYEYEYYDPIPFELMLGTGFTISQAKLKSAVFDKSINQFAIPLSLRLKKGNFFIETGLSYQNLNFDFPVTETIETEVAHTITETVVVDTYYRYNNGEPIEVVVTKEVERTEYEIVQEEITNIEDRNYSSLKFPLKLGYCKLFNRLMLRTDAGAAFNLLTTDAKSDLEIDFPDANSCFYTYELGFGAGYSITDNILIDCGFSFSTKTNSHDYKYSTHNLELRFFYKMF